MGRSRQKRDPESIGYQHLVKMMTMPQAQAKASNRLPYGAVEPALAGNMWCRDHGCLQIYGRPQIGGNH